MSASIREVRGREVIDSRGNPTVEVEVELSEGSQGRAIVPSGASTGEHEVLELRDHDPHRFGGKGVLKAVGHVNGPIREAVQSKSFNSIQELDNCLTQLDGTEQKSNLGANAILGVSLAYAHAAATAQKTPLYLYLGEQMGIQESSMRLPVPLMNVLNGGEHANNPLEFQEFMIVPHGFSNFAESLRAGCEVFQCLRKILHSHGQSTAVGDEGGFAPTLGTEDALRTIAQAIGKAGYRLGEQISLALDVAASSFYDKKSGNYRFRHNDQPYQTRDELIAYYNELANQFPIVSVEDGLDENDWDGWGVYTSKLNNSCQLVGDDLFVTNKKFVQRGIDNNVANAVLIKVNQIGSVSETFDTMNLCYENNYRCVVSHRSGETEDVSIAHLAVGSGAGQIKTGSLSRGERTAKYNELLRISDWAERNKRPLSLATPFQINPQNRS